MHIAIAGNIGTGKTTLTRLLSKHYGWSSQFEDVEDNPYLSDFYNDMKRWSFNLQVYFLNTRFEQIIKIKKSKKTFIQDRTIYEDAFIFAPNLHSLGLMDVRDFNNYFALFQMLNSFIEPPDLLIYLKASVPTLVNQIQKRGREYENTIRLDYLRKLNERYESWIENYNESKLITINIDKLEFSENPKDLNQIISKIDAEIHGVFSVQP